MTNIEKWDEIVDYPKHSRTHTHSQHNSDIYIYFSTLLQSPTIIHHIACVLTAVVSNYHKHPLSLHLALSPPITITIFTASTHLHPNTSSASGSLPVFTSIAHPIPPPLDVCTITHALPLKHPSCQRACELVKHPIP